MPFLLNCRFESDPQLKFHLFPTILTNFCYLGLGIGIALPPLPPLTDGTLGGHILEILKSHLCPCSNDF